MKKGIVGKSTSQLQKSVKTQFSSATFKKQVDKIIDDLYIYTVSSTDKLINKSLSAGLTRFPVSNFLSASDTNTQDDDESLTEEALYLALTLEAVDECIDLSQNIAQTIENDLKKETISKENHTQKILDLWKKYKYKAERWVKNVSVDVANNIASYRYQQRDIEYCQFVAIIDNRTSPQCRVLNGTIFKCDSKEVQRFRPPLHPYCRSTILPITDYKKVVNSLKFENRDFANPIGYNLRQTGESFNSTKLKKIFDDVDKYKGNYKIEQKILDLDIEKRFKKLHLDINTKSKTVDNILPTQTLKPEELKQKITDFEISIKNNDVEHGAIFSTNGDIIIKKVGDVDQITWTREEREVMRGTILTHNHPNNAGFSPEDIKFACSNGLKEIRAVGPTRSYTMHFQNGRNFAGEDWAKLENSFEHNYRMGVAKERIDYKNNPTDGKIWDKDKATEHVANYAWIRTVKEINGLVYRVGVAK